MPVKCVVNADELLTIPRARLVERITTLPPEKMSDVAKAIIFALDLRIK